MKSFRLPRKLKKSLKGKLWLYPADEKGNSLMASPARSQADFTAVKQGVVKDLFSRSSRRERKEQNRKLDQDVNVPDDVLKAYVDNLIRKDLRNSSYQTLLEAKDSPKAVVAYYNFINAYHEMERDNDLSGNVCCMAIDRAEMLLKRDRKRKALKKQNRKRRGH